MPKSQPRKSRVLAQLIAEAKRQGWNAWQLHERCDLSHGTAASYWNGVHPAALVNLEHIASKLGYRLTLEPKA